MDTVTYTPPDPLYTSRRYVGVTVTQARCVQAESLRLSSRTVEYNSTGKNTTERIE